MSDYHFQAASTKELLLTGAEDDDGLTEGDTYAWYVVSRDADSGDDLAPGEIHQMGVFTATAAGTDDVAPELTNPEAATITAGEAFDPMAGVSATDNTDGDLTDAVRSSAQSTPTPPAPTC